MKVRILGTGYGDCKIKKKSSRDFRRKGGVIVDDKILIDAAEDIFDIAKDFACKEILDGIEAVFISHSHPGHFSPAVIEKLCAKRDIRIFASDVVLDMLPEIEHLEKCPILPFLPIELGSYKIIPLPANHSTQNPAEYCLNFTISRDKTLFYALDGGFLNYEAYKVLLGLKIDAVIADCALEMKEPSHSSMDHGSLESARLMRDILVGAGIAMPSLRFVLSHIPTDKKRMIHDELTEAAAEYGISVAYDGYFLNI